MTCKDCVHYDVCYELTYHEPNGEIVGREVCNNFKDKSRFVELPCKVGDVVYAIFYIGTPSQPSIYKSKVNEIVIVDSSEPYYNQPFIVLDVRLCDTLIRRKTSLGISDFNKTVFLTREEAEKALEERNKK